MISKIDLKKILVKTSIFFLLTGYIIQSYSQVRFAVIGDYGLAGVYEDSVANLIKSWNPDFIITLGDNNYSIGADSTIDENIGQYYHQYIYPYKGIFGEGSQENRFFPALGNHDWITDSAKAYFDYFELPGNERYYDFTKDNVHFFVLDSDPKESDGIDENSVQALWLKQALNNSPTYMWNIVYFHHPPYSSGPHGSALYMRWALGEWGANLVLSGHEHTYERIFADGLTYIVNGLGGKSLYSFLDPIPESIVRYSGNYGAMLIEAYQNELVCKFININDSLIDYHKINDTTLYYPSKFILYQNYPNPFNSTTSIQINVPVASKVKLKVYDLLGREVATLINSFKPEGIYYLKFNANNLSSGVYLYKLQTDSYIDIKKMILLK